MTIEEDVDRFEKGVSIGREFEKMLPALEPKLRLSKGARNLFGALVEISVQNGEDLLAVCRSLLAMPAFMANAEAEGIVRRLLGAVAVNGGLPSLAHGVLKEIAAQRQAPEDDAKG